MSIWGGRSNVGIPGWGGNTGGAGAPGGPGGGNKGNNNDNEDHDYDDSNNSSQKKDNDNVRVIADFDASALERGAKAMKEIDASENSKDVLRLALETERTKQKEADLKGAEIERENIMRKQQLMEQEYNHQSRLEEERSKRDQEGRRQDAQMKQEMHKQKLEEKRRTNDEWLANQKRLFEEQQSLEKKTALEIEEEKRRTMDYQANLDRETAKIRADAESDGRIRQERENVDINEKLSRTRLEEDRKTRLAIRKEELEYYASFFASLRDTVTSPEKLPYLVGGVSGMAFGIYGSRMGLNVAGRFIESRIGKPSLVRETSRMGWRDLSVSKMYKRWGKQTYKPEDLLKNIVLQPSLENKMSFIGRATRKTRENSAPFRHVLIHGPPGTGKTLFARSLAQNSGMHYAVVTGGDFAPLGANAVTELHKLFDWAESSNKGMILFIDEADAFLRKGRGDQHAMSENMRNALSAFLFRTGTETDKFMIVLATNIPEALDSAVLDRVDEAVEFPNPGGPERKRILQQYFRQYIKQEVLDKGKATVIKTSFDEEDEVFDRLTTQTEGFSGRQLSKFMISVQSSVYAGVADELHPSILEQILQTHLKAKKHGIQL